MTDQRQFQHSFSAVILMAAFVLLPVRLGHAGLNHWTAHGPAGGPISAIAIDQTTPTVLYASAAGGGLFKSTDGGTRWTAKAVGLTAISVNTIAIDPLTPTTLYAGTDGGVFKSIDAGESWRAVYRSFLPFSAPLFFPDSITVLAINPQTPTTLYAGSGTGLSAGTLNRSTDGGMTWVKIENGLPNAAKDIQVVAFAVHPRTPMTLYVALNRIVYLGGPIPPRSVPEGLFKSVDGGATWTRLPTDFPAELFIYTIRIDPQSPTVLYVGTSNGVFVSKDAGNHWTAANSGIEDASVRTLSINQARPAQLYAGTERGVFRSLNDGAQWEPINTGLPVTSVHAMVIDSGASPTLYIGTEQGLYKSNNAGQQWQVADTGIANASVTALLLDPTAPSTLYAATFQGPDHFLLKSTNGGTDWTTLPASPLSATLHLKAIAPTTPTTLYALTEEGADPPDLLKSQDGGNNWSIVRHALPVHSLVVDPQTPTRLYALGSLSGVLRSIDAGNTWTPLGGLDTLSISSLAIDPITPTILYVSTTDGLLKSTDGGMQWSPINTGLPLTTVSLIIDAHSPNTLYATAPSFLDGQNYTQAIFTSSDGGATWRKTGFPTTPFLSISQTVIDPQNSSTLYASTRYGGIWKSADGGASWAPMDTGLTTTGISALLIHPNTGKTLYLATQRGVFAFEVGAPLVDLAIAQQDSPNPVFRRAPLSYVLTVTNNGSSAVSGAHVHSTLSPDVSLDSLTASQGYCQAITTIACDLGSLASGASAIVQIVVKPMIAGELHNIVSITGLEPDPITANNVVRVTTTVVPPPGPDLTGTWLQVTQKCKGKSEPQRCKIKGRLLVHNQGAHTVPASTFQVLSWLPYRYSTPQLLAQFTLPPLKAGRKKKFKITIFSPTQTTLSGHYLAANFDPDNTIDEMDENNNWVSSSVIP